MASDLMSLSNYTPTFIILLSISIYELDKVSVTAKTSSARRNEAQIIVP